MSRGDLDGMAAAIRMVISCRGLSMIAGQIVWCKRFFGFDCRGASTLILIRQDEVTVRRQLSLFAFLLTAGGSFFLFRGYVCLSIEASRASELGEVSRAA
jgi:hypothetical protein